jgi:hypothetical protein
VKIFIQISRDHGQDLMDHLPRDTRAYSLIENGVVTYDRRTAKSVIEILCEISEAEALLDAATLFCPEAVREIGRSIRPAPMRQS